MAFSTFLAQPNEGDIEQKTVEREENEVKIERVSPPLCSSENYTLIDKTERDVPTRLDENGDKKQNRNREKCPHKSKDIKDCDRARTLNLKKRIDQSDRLVSVKVEKWEFIFAPNENQPVTLDEKPIIYK